MVQFILSSMDKSNDVAVLGVPVDFSKAFNRMLHSNILCNLDALNVPKCAIKLIQSYLTRRSMCVHYKGEESSFQNCPGGGPQGGLLTGILFILQTNKAGAPCAPQDKSTITQDAQSSRLEEDSNSSLRMEAKIEIKVTDENQLRLEEVQDNFKRMDGDQVNEYWLEGREDNSLWMDGDKDSVWNQDATHPPLCTAKEKLHKKAFVDDLTLLEKISLKDLQKKKRIIGPLNYHDRFNLAMPPHKSILQHQLQDLKLFTKEHHMFLNSTKTKCIPFNSSKSRDFMPELQLEEGSFLEVIYQLKLVGLVITSELTWSAHVDYTVNRVNKVLWQLTRFKQLGAAQDKLITFYKLKIRSILMFGAVCFHSSLTIQQSQQLELQQRRSLAIILGSQYGSYEHARSLVNLPKLDKLRQEACLNWAIKASTNPKHSHLFPLSYSNVDTRNRKKYAEYFCRSAKYYNSAVPSMTRALNKHCAHKQTK